MVAFTDKERLIGASAGSQLALHPQLTFQDLTLLIAAEGELEGRQTAYTVTRTGEGLSKMAIDCGYAQELSKNSGVDLGEGVSSVVLVASLLKEYVKYVESDSLFWQFRKRLAEKTAKRVDYSVGSKAVTKCVISAPLSFTASQRSALQEASSLAGLDLLALVDGGTAAAAAFLAYHRENLPERVIPPAVEATPAVESAPPVDTTPSEESNEKKGMTVSGDAMVFVDMGSRYLNVAAARVNSSACHILTKSSTRVGGGDLEERLLDHMLEVFRKKYASGPCPIPEKLNARSTARLTRAVQKAVTVLSTTATAPVEVPNLVTDLDASAPIDRAEFERICSAELERVKATVRSAIVEAGFEDTAVKVEVVGGATRTPAVQRAICSAAGADQVHRNIDGNFAVSIGCALVAALASPAGEGKVSDGEETEPLLKVVDDLCEESIRLSSSLLERKERAEREAEEKLLVMMAEMDEKTRAYNELRNGFVQYIYATQEQLQEPSIRASSECRAEADILEPLLFAEQQWLLYSDEGEEATAEELEKRLGELKASVQEKAPTFSDALVKREQEKEEAARQAAEEEKNRVTVVRDKLKNPKTPKEKLEAAQKRKEQGNVLFKQLAYDEAVLRYRKALLLADEVQGEKFVDDVKAVKLGCLVNLAVSYLKLDKAKLAEENCTRALDIDDNSKRALFQRGMAKMKQKLYSAAIVDFEAVLAIDPDSKPAKKQVLLANRSIAKQKSQEKKMYQKMFS